MLQAIYWILAIVVMILLLINTIKSIKTDSEFRRYIKKQELLVEKQLMDSLMGSISGVLDKIKNESEDK